MDKMDKDQTMDQMPDKELKFVHQLLMEHNFENTAAALMIEAAIKGFPNLEQELKTEDEIYKNYHEQMMLSYKTGDWKTFLQLWNLLVPEDMKHTKAYKVIMLHLYVYFAILPKRISLLHWHKQKDKTQLNNVIPFNQLNSEYDENFITEIEKNMNEGMEQLREFLNTTGKELKNDTELRPYFALPFMEDPCTEPFLAKVFENDWSNQLTENLQLFLDKCKSQSFSFSKCNDEDSTNLSSNYSSLSREPKTDAVVIKTLKCNNIPIIPNDRNIPMFLEEDTNEETYNLYEDTKYSRKSKSIQTVSIHSSEGDIYSTHLTKRNKKLIQCVQELAITKSHLCNVHSNYEKLKVSFHKLHTDYHKLMSIARVLTSTLENSVKGQVVDLQIMLENCIQIFPDLFNQNIKDSSHCNSEIMLGRSFSNLKIANSITYNSTVSPKLLDFKKIKLDLINGSIKTKLFLLQALRRKITLSQSGERDETVHEYISKDLLGLHSQIASYKGKSILPYLLNPQNVIIPHPLQQSITRLLNALASFRCGRDYLSIDSTVVNMVFQCLNSTSDNNIDTLTCNMIIGMLQKLSLRKQQRIYMIENGLMEWLIRHLHDQYHVMDSYRLEYATALLMNLSLHQVAQRRAAAMASLLISTLTELLLLDHDSTLPYITGALNNFLSNRVINEEAKKMKFASILEQYNKHKSGDIRKNLELVLNIHRGEIIIKTEDEEMADDDNEEYDILESQLEENDPVKNNYGELNGDSLLETCYTIFPKAMQSKEIIPDMSSSRQFKLNAIKSDMHPNQVIDLRSTHEMILHEDVSRKLIKKQHNMKSKDNSVILREVGAVPREESFAKKYVNKKREVKCKDKSIMQRDSTQNSVGQLKSSPHAVQLNSALTKDRPLYRQQSTNEKWSLNDTKFSFKDFYDESATYIYENQTSKESSKTTVASSTLLAVGSEAESTVMEKLSSIASLNIEEKNNKLDNITWTPEKEFDSEQAFRTKPKIPRTPL